MGNVKYGKGIFYHANGCVYEGDWRCGEEHGVGKLYRRKKLNVNGQV